MATETKPTIRSIDITNADLISVLATLASGGQATIAVVGDDERRMAVPEDETNVGSDLTFDAERLVDDGSLAETITLLGNTVEVQIV